MEPRKVSFSTEIVKNVTGTPPRKLSIGSQGTSRSDGSVQRDSPLVARSSIFYQPLDKDRAEDLPEADQRTPRKEGAVYDGQGTKSRMQAGVNSNSEPHRSTPMPEASTPKNDSNAQARTSSSGSSSSKQDKHEKPGSKDNSAEKKKNALWYDYGNV